jgi:Fe-S cluster assembly iron-binding protein IscA
MTTSNDYNGIMARIKADIKKSADKAIALRATLLEVLPHYKVAFVEISFSGSGDSGSIDDIDVLYLNTSDENTTVIPDGIRQQISEFAYAYLQGTDVDWYNNEGGQGKISLDFRNVPYSFKANIYTNVIEEIDAHSAEEPL